MIFKDNLGTSPGHTFSSPPSRGGMSFSLIYTLVIIAIVNIQHRKAIPQILSISMLLPPNTYQKPGQGKQRLSIMAWKIWNNSPFFSLLHLEQAGLAEKQFGPIFYCPNHQHHQVSNLPLPVSDRLALPELAFMKFQQPVLWSAAMNMPRKFMVVSTTSERTICYSWEEFLPGIRSEVCSTSSE